MFRQPHLPANTPGRLYLHSMPGRYEPLQAVYAAIAENGISRIICLAPLAQIQKHSLAYAQDLSTGTVPVPVIHQPVPDFGLPQDAAAFDDCAESVAQALQQGDNILVHCAGGIGRTGMFAVVVLWYLGLSLDDATSAVEAADSHPENRHQRAYVADLPNRAERRRPA